jgi:hypothetical protein
MCPPDYIVESDGSLEGGGTILYKIEGNLKTCKGGSGLSIKEYELEETLAFRIRRCVTPG